MGTKEFITFLFLIRSIISDKDNYFIYNYFSTIDIVIFLLTQFNNFLLYIMLLHCHSPN